MGDLLPFLYSDATISLAHLTVTNQPDQPDLVGDLLPFLDSDATISLAHLTCLNTAHGRALWNKLIIRRHVCVRREESTSPDHWDQEKEFAQVKILVMDLVNVLKMKEESSSIQLDLLNFICERFSASQIPNLDFVEMRSSPPLHTFHTVSPLDFLLLEAAEGALGSTNLTLESVVVTNLDDHLLSAIANGPRNQWALGSTNLTLESVVVTNLDNHLLSAIASRLSRQLQQGLGVKLTTRLDIGQNIVVRSQEYQETGAPGLTPGRTLLSGARRAPRPCQLSSTIASASTSTVA